MFFCYKKSDLVKWDSSAKHSLFVCLLIYLLTGYQCNQWPCQAMWKSKTSRPNYYIQLRYKHHYEPVGTAFRIWMLSYTGKKCLNWNLMTKQPSSGSISRKELVHTELSISPVGLRNGLHWRNLNSESAQITYNFFLFLCMHINCTWMICMQHFPHLHTFESLQQKAVFLRNLNTPSNHATSYHHSSG